jgi:hypothetical protein
MGKFLVKLGLWIQRIWCKFQCKWNSFMLSLSFKNIDKCPNKLCACSKDNSAELNMPTPTNMGKAKKKK